MNLLNFQNYFNFFENNNNIDNNENIDNDNNNNNNNENNNLIKKNNSINDNNKDKKLIEINIKNNNNNNNNKNLIILSEKIKNELEINKLCDNENVVTFFGWSLNENFIYLIFELISGGDLKSIIEKNILTDIQKINISIGICNGLKYLHNKNIIHMDLKSSNILVNN
jgi:hypothetical protein